MKRISAARRLTFACMMLIFAAVAEPHTAMPAENVFPAPTGRLAPPLTSVSTRRLDAVAAALGNRGCAIKHGYVVKAWGPQDDRTDLFSSAKPVLSTLLMFALAENKISSFDQTVVDFGWPLVEKDRTMTLRHLASMTSGYARPEEPGRGWAYNDYAIQLYQKTLFDRIFAGPPEEVFHDPRRFGALGLQDGFTFRKSNRRMTPSVRDFARVAWFWLNRGYWNGVQLLPRSYFDDNMRPQAPKDLPLSSDAPDQRLPGYWHLRRRVKPFLQGGARHLRLQLVVQRHGPTSPGRHHLARCPAGHGDVAGTSRQLLGNHS